MIPPLLAPKETININKYINIKKLSQNLSDFEKAQSVTTLLILYILKLLVTVILSGLIFILEPLTSALKGYLSAHILKKVS